MCRIKKEGHINPRRLPNGKYYVKLENEYIGTFTEKELEKVKKEIYIMHEKGISYSTIIEIEKEKYVDFEKGKAVSKGMNENKFKQYNKRLQKKVIAKNKELAKYFKCTEEKMLTDLINDKYKKIF